MDCVVVSSLLGIVDQLQLLLLQKPPLNNPCFILPDDAQIILSALKEKLHFLQAYLHKPKPIITSDPNLDEAVKRVDEEIRDVAMKAEDEIESKVGEIYQVQGEGEGVAVKACEDLHRSLQQVVKDFESVEVRIRDLQMRHTASIDDASSSSSTPPCLQLQNVSSSSSSSSSNYDLENTTMIGIEDGVEEIKGMLLQTSSSTQLQVVSILGIDGTGKTTLAKKVYEDPSIVSHFDIQAWVESQLHSRKNLLIDILSCIVSLTKEEISKQDDEQLAEQLRKLLMGQRYLIVIDDLWSKDAWDELSTSFPDDRNGSRVLITTRLEGVSRHTGSGIIYRTGFLNLEESWNLLSKTATSSNGKWSSLSPEFEIIGRRIAEKCKGIPLLLIVSIGGLLATLNNSPRQWEDILDILLAISSREDYFQILFSTIEVCYNYLPTHLKPCFIYFGIFIKNTEIHVNKLIKLWVAEGFINSEMNKNKSLEEIAKDYLCDLINRRLVQIHKRSLDRKIKSCMLHDLLRDFCTIKARNEDIMMDIHTWREPFFLLKTILGGNIVRLL